MRLIAVALVLGICSTADAMITFPHSAVIDEMDFAGHQKVSVPSLCSDLCHVYASVDSNYKEIAENLLIQTARGFVTLADIAYQTDTNTGRKIPLEIRGAATLVIQNANRGYTSGVVAVYIVNQNADYFKTAQVYDAASLDRKPDYVQAITIFSANTFTLRESSSMSMGVIAKLAGFDALNSDFCTTVYSLESQPFPGFTFSIKSPLVSVLYNLEKFPNPAGELTTRMGQVSAHPMEQNGFFTSAGWHACSGKEPYRSRNYETTLDFEQQLSDSDDQDVVLEVQTNVRKEGAILVTSSNGTEIARFYHNVNSQELAIRDHFIRFDWTPRQGDHFLVRYNSTATPVY